MSHKHYSTLRGHRLGFNPSAESHDLLFGRPISYYYKSKDKTGGRRTDWNSKQAATVIFPSLAATSMTVNFILAALQFIPIPENLIELISSPTSLCQCSTYSHPFCGFLPSSSVLLLPSQAHCSPFSLKHTHMQLFRLSFQIPIYFKSSCQCQLFTDACSLTHPHTAPAFASSNPVLLFEFFHLLQSFSSHPSKL